MYALLTFAASETEVLSVMPPHASLSQWAWRGSPGDPPPGCMAMADCCTAQVGAGFWLREGVAERAEALAKAQFAARRDAHDCALLYLALGRRALLQVNTHTQPRASRRACPMDCAGYLPTATAQRHGGSLRHMWGAPVAMPSMDALHWGSIWLRCRPPCMKRQRAKGNLQSTTAMPLQGLFRSTGQAKLAKFLARDFGDGDAGAAGRQAAAKNAFVLISQHRAALAAAFFVLGAPQAPELQ